MDNCRELELWKKYDFLLGMDEAGRGPWAGPIFAAAVIFPKDLDNIPEDFILKINDSKLLKEKDRLELFKDIKRYSLAWSVSNYSAEEIDSMGIGVANQLIMEKLYKNIKRKIKKIDLVLLDQIGGFNSRNFPYEMYAKGDQLFLSIAAASILAKVSRDSLMKKYDKEFPQYSFAKHKGYGTKIHQEALDKYGLCKIHRKSFSPMREMVQVEEQLGLGF
jgi:ribonuclease HII